MLLASAMTAMLLTDAGAANPAQKTPRVVLAERSDPVARACAWSLVDAFVAGRAPEDRPLRLHEEVGATRLTTAAERGVIGLHVFEVMQPHFHHIEDARFAISPRGRCVSLSPCWGEREDGSNGTWLSTVLVAWSGARIETGESLDPAELEPYIDTVLRIVGMRGEARLVQDVSDIPSFTTRSVRGRRSLVLVREALAEVHVTPNATDDGAHFRRVSWDPVTGDVHALDGFASTDGGIGCSLTLVARRVGDYELRRREAAGWRWTGSEWRRTGAMPR